MGGKRSVLYPHSLYPPNNHSVRRYNGSKISPCPLAGYFYVGETGGNQVNRSIKPFLKNRVTGAIKSERA